MKNYTLDQNLIKVSTLTPKTILLNFPDAVREVLGGNKLTRVSWDNPQTFILLDGEFLSISIDGKVHQLIVSLGDLEGIDWYVINSEVSN